MLIADEPVSSLDASIRGEILALLLGCARSSGSGSSWSTHDLGLAWNIADRIAVMYLGRVVEVGTHRGGARVARSTRTPRRCCRVVPEIAQLEPIVLRGEIPDPTRIPGGCRFHPRCPALADGAAAAAGVEDAVPNDGAGRAARRRRAPRGLPPRRGAHRAAEPAAARCVPD